MINHLQTLLLNESASVVVDNLDVSDYGFVDPGFSSVAPDKSISAIYLEMFPKPDVDDKFRRVTAYLPYMMAPEFSAFKALFDARVTSTKVPPETVFDFYTSMSNSSFYPVMSYVSSVSAPASFTPSGLGVLDQYLGSLKRIYSECKESSKRFSALLYAVAIHLEAAHARA